MLALVMGATDKVARTFLTRFLEGTRARGMNIDTPVHCDVIAGARGAAGVADGAATSSSTRLSTTSMRADGIRKIGKWAEA
jgi:hypothetical protein